MAKNNLVKWIIGAGSVAAFTSFVGIANGFDATKANQANKGEGAVQSATDTTATDATKQEWQANSDDQAYFGREGHEKEHGEGDDDDEAYEHGYNGGSTQNSGSAVTGNTTVNQPTTTPAPRKARTRAS